LSLPQNGPLKLKSHGISNTRISNKTSNALVFSGWSITGSVGKSLIRHMAMVDRPADILTFITTKGTSEAVAHLFDVGVRQNFPTPTFHPDTVTHMSNWEEVYESLDVAPLSHYEALFIIGGVYRPNSGVQRFSKRVGVFPKDNGQLTWRSTAKPLIHLLTMLKLNNEFGTPIHEFSFDPLEMSLDQLHPELKPKTNYRLYHGCPASAPLRQIKGFAHGRILVSSQ